MQEFRDDLTTRSQAIAGHFNSMRVSLHVLTLKPPYITSDVRGNVFFLQMNETTFYLKYTVSLKEANYLESNNFMTGKHKFIHLIAG